MGFKPPAFVERWSYQASLSPLTRAYMEINKALRRLNASPDVNDTPAERAAKLMDVLPAAKDHVNCLLAEYHLSIYGKRPANATIAHLAGTEIRKLSYQSLIKNLTGRKEGAFSKAN
jgi:hypothetical protein